MKLYLAKNRSIKFSTVPDIVGNGRVYTRHHVITAKLCGEDESSMFDADKLTSLLNNGILDKLEYGNVEQAGEEEHQNNSEIPP